MRDDIPGGVDGQQPQRDPFSDLRFYGAYFLTLLIFAAASWLLTGGYRDYGAWTIGALLLSIPYIIAGLIAWSIMRKKNRAIALGLLYGSITPMIVIFIVTDGCGMFVFR